jgi:hypothetical protein
MNRSAIHPEPRIPQRMTGASLEGSIRDTGNDLGNDMGWFLQFEWVGS